MCSSRSSSIERSVGVLLLYLGWEGVGLASYLLIGFWQHKPGAATAA
ncbi:proton-conducting transporter membrane subunit, partial [Streptomyces hirsutus]